jgi:hypothetical protein
MVNRWDTPYYQLRRKIIFDVLDRFPNHGNRTLARKLFEEHPEHFTSADNARSLVRFYRGSCGQEHLNSIKNKTYVRKPISPA